MRKRIGLRKNESTNNNTTLIVGGSIATAAIAVVLLILWVVYKNKKNEKQLTPNSGNTPGGNKAANATPFGVVDNNKKSNLLGTNTAVPNLTSNSKHTPATEQLTAKPTTTKPPTTLEAVFKTLVNSKQDEPTKSRKVEGGSHSTKPNPKAESFVRENIVNPLATQFKNKVTGLSRPVIEIPKEAVTLGTEAIKVSNGPLSDFLSSLAHDSVEWTKDELTYSLFPGLPYYALINLMNQLYIGSPEVKENALAVYNSALKGCGLVMSPLSLPSSPPKDLELLKTTLNIYRAILDSGNSAFELLSTMQFTAIGFIINPKKYEFLWRVLSIESLLLKLIMYCDDHDAENQCLMEGTVNITESALQLVHACFRYFESEFLSDWAVFEEIFKEVHPSIEFKWPDEKSTNVMSNLIYMNSCVHKMLMFRNGYESSFASCILEVKPSATSGSSEPGKSLGFTKALRQLLGVEKVDLLTKGIKRVVFSIEIVDLAFMNGAKWLKYADEDGEKKPVFLKGCPGVHCASIIFSDNTGLKENAYGLKLKVVNGLHGTVMKAYEESDYKKRGVDLPENFDSVRSGKVTNFDEAIQFLCSALLNGCDISPISMELHESKQISIISAFLSSFAEHGVELLFNSFNIKGILLDLGVKPEWVDIAKAWHVFKPDGSINLGPSGGCGSSDEESFLRRIGKKVEGSAEYILELEDLPAILLEANHVKDVCLVQVKLLAEYVAAIDYEEIFDVIATQGLEGLLTNQNVLRVKSMFEELIKCLETSVKPLVNKLKLDCVSQLLDSFLSKEKGYWFNQLAILVNKIPDLVKMCIKKAEEHPQLTKIFFAKSKKLMKHVGVDGEDEDEDEEDDDGKGDEGDGEEDNDENEEALEIELSEILSIPELEKKLSTIPELLRKHLLPKAELTGMPAGSEPEELKTAVVQAFELSGESQNIALVMGPIGNFVSEISKTLNSQELCSCILLVNQHSTVDFKCLYDYLFNWIEVFGSASRFDDIFRYKSLFSTINKILSKEAGVAICVDRHNVVGECPLFCLKEVTSGKLVVESTGIVHAFFDGFSMLVVKLIQKGCGSSQKYFDEVKRLRKAFGPRMVELMNPSKSADDEAVKPHPVVSSRP